MVGEHLGDGLRNPMRIPKLRLAPVASLLTELQAASLIAHRIRVNSVSPGPIETPILDDFKADHGKDKVESARQALGRYGQPADVANVVARLFEDPMQWVNEADIRVDGGLIALRETAQVRAR